MASAFLSLVCSATALAAAGDVVTATYGDFSLSPPTPSSVFVCHGFGCKFRNEVAFSDMDRARLAQLMKPGKTSAAAERAAVSVAGAWFDRRIAVEAGTQRHIARAGMSHMNEPAQYDCIDTSRNTTSLLLVLEQLKLLRWHSVDSPRARGYLIDGRPPHATAILVEKTSGERWSVDAWTRGYGEPPEIMRLSVWLNSN